MTQITYHCAKEQYWFHIREYELKWKIDIVYGSIAQLIIAKAWSNVGLTDRIINFQREK